MKSDDSMIATTRRSYTEAFKEEAVRLVRESGHSVAQVARDLGIAPSAPPLRAEQRQAEGRGQPRQSLRAEQAELARLRRENAILKQERDCLRIYGRLGAAHRLGINPSVPSAVA